MPTITEINHVTLVVQDLETAIEFYEREFNLEALPAFEFDFPAQFYRINDRQQLHLTEWPDSPSFRGHVCFRVDDFSDIFHRMREQGRIDTAPWGQPRRLPDGAMQMFVRDPFGNLLEISSEPGAEIDPAIFEDTELMQGDGLYVSNRNDARGLQGENATLYHGKSEA